MRWPGIHGSTAIATSEQAIQAAACGKLPAAPTLQGCTGQQITCHMQSLQDLALAALESCRGADASLSTYKAGSTNLERVHEFLALADCAQLVPTDKDTAEASYQQAVERCKKQAAR